MTLLDLIEKDIEGIEEFYEEFYKDKKEHNLENFTQFLKEVFNQNVKKEYSICSMDIEIQYEVENYIFIFEMNEFGGRKYALEIDENSCGGDCCIENNGRTAKRIFEDKLGKVKIDFGYEE